MGRIVFPFAKKPVGRAAGLSISRAKAMTRPLAPRVAPAAVRVPDPRHVQVEIPFPNWQPQLFVHEGVRQALERRLMVAARRPAVLSVTDNRRSVLVFAVLDGVLRVRLHHMFLDAPQSVQSSLVRYVVARMHVPGERARRAPPERETRALAAASAVVSRYIDANTHRMRAVRPVLSPLDTQGEHHDLLSMFQQLNDKYFGGTVDALITWGRRTRRADPRRPRRSIKLGSYSASERLIRIHPGLDRAWIPRYFVSYIVYHEMLHHVVPGEIQGARGRAASRRSSAGRTNLHPPAFLERERLFRDYERALAWERAHIRRLMRL